MSAVRAFLKRILLPLLQALHRRRRAAEIRATSRLVTVIDLQDNLAELPIDPGGVVLVHSSLKALGFVENGPTAVIAALKSELVDRRGGTLMIPTYSMNGTMEQTLRQGRSFDVRFTRSNLGALPEAFRRWPGVRRSIHPTHSFAAIGSKAEWLTRDHHLDDKSFGRRSPMGKMIECRSYLLGIGTTLGPVTFYHCLEDIETFPFQVYTERAFESDCIDYQGRTHRVSVRAHDTVVSATRIDRAKSELLRDAYTRWMEREAGLTWYTIGEARCWLVDAQCFYREAKRLMELGLTIYSDDDAVRHFTKTYLGS